MKTDAPDDSNFPTRHPPGLYDDDADRNKHMAYMTSIAEEKHRDITDIVPYYEHILFDLRGQARVHDYLNIFVAKKVLEQLNSFR